MLNSEMPGSPGVQVVPADLLVPCVCSGYAELFERSKSLPDTEGIVLKHVTSIARVRLANATSIRSGSR
jgi:hypothetical protein